MTLREAGIEATATPLQAPPPFDVAVIGAGVVGCAVARRFALEGARVVVLEKAADVLDGASKGNSGILHTGFDAPPGSLEQACVAAGHAEYLEIRERLGLPLLETGALVLSWSDAEADRLPGLREAARTCGVADVALVDAATVYAREPNLAPGVRAGLLVPREHVIDPWSAPHAYLAQALAHGAELRLRGAVTGGGREGGEWRLATRAGEVRARLVVNCAGLYGDRVDARLLGTSDFEIRPRKGQFVVLDKCASKFLRTTLLPLPSATTKGVVLCRTAFGNVLVGPTAEEQESRTDASVDRATLEALRTRAGELVPALKRVPITACYAGLRPATEQKHYRVSAYPAEAYVSVGGIRSTGLSAALGLARHVYELTRDFVASAEPLADVAWPRAAMLAEHEPRDWSRPGNEGIVCHCERVTRREIRAALEGPMPARTFAGLKRRTRATLGRCQGFYCTAELSRMTAGRFAEPTHP